MDIIYLHETRLITYSTTLIISAENENLMGMKMSRDSDNNLEIYDLEPEQRPVIPCTPLALQPVSSAMPPLPSPPPVSSAALPTITQPTATIPAGVQPAPIDTNIGTEIPPTTDILFDSPTFRDRFFGGFQIGTVMRDRAVEAALSVTSAVGENTEKAILDTVDKIPRYSQYEMDRIMNEQKQLLKELANTSFLLGVSLEKEKSLQQQLDALKSIEDMAKERIRNENSELERLQDMARTLENEIFDLNTAKESLEERLKANERQIHEFETLLEEQAQINDRLRMELSEMASDQAQAKDEMEKAFQKVVLDFKEAELARDKAIAEAEVAQDMYKSDRLTSEADYARYRDHMSSQQEWHTTQIIEKDQLIANLEEELHKASQELPQIPLMKEKIELLEQKLNESSNYHEQQVSHLSTGLSQQSVLLNDSKEQNAKYQRDISDLQGLVEDYKNQLLSITRQQDDQFDSYNRNLNERDHHIALITNQLQQANEAIKGLESQLQETIQSQNHSVNTMKRNHESKQQEFVQALRVAEETHSRQRIDLEDKLKDSLKQIEMHETIETQLRAKEFQLLSSEMVLQDEIRQLKEKDEKSRQDYLRLQNEYLTTQLEGNHRRAELEEAYHNIELLKDQIRLTQTQSLTASESSLKLQDALSIKTNELHAARQEMIDLQATVNQLSNELKTVTKSRDDNMIHHEQVMNDLQVR